MSDNNQTSLTGSQNKITGQFIAEGATVTVPGIVKQLLPDGIFAEVEFSGKGSAVVPVSVLVAI